jgi:hypothetical protein
MDVFTHANLCTCRCANYAPRDHSRGSCVEVHAMHACMHACMCVCWDSYRRSIYVRLYSRTHVCMHIPCWCIYQAPQDESRGSRWVAGSPGTRLVGCKPQPEGVCVCVYVCAFAFRPCSGVCAWNVRICAWKSGGGHCSKSGYRLAPQEVNVCIIRPNRSLCVYIQVHKNIFELTRIHILNRSVLAQKYVDTYI